MENAPNLNPSRLSEMDFSDGDAGYVEPLFYERPENVNRNLTEVAPQPNETDTDFVTRANDELSDQYPDSSKKDRIKMAKMALAAERQQMDPGYQERQQGHEASVDEAYRRKTAELQEEYEKGKTSIKNLQDLGILSEENLRAVELDNRRAWLDRRREAFEQYDAEFHERVDADTPTAEDVDQFRKQEMDELNQKHEQMMNYEARRLGVREGLDFGLTLELADGDFRKEATADDLKDTVGRGLESSGFSASAAEAGQFIDKLWQPEIETIKHNAVMRAIASPVRRRTVVHPDGTSLDESKFILPIQNQWFTEYVAENIQSENDVLAACAGLSETLKYGSREEAAERADWFYGMVHEEAGLEAGDILTKVEALGIMRNDHEDRKWSERYDDFVSRHWDDMQQEPQVEQVVGDIEEIKMSSEQLRDQLAARLRDLRGDLDFQTIGKTRSGGIRKGGKQRTPTEQLADEIIMLNRSIQHIEGTNQIIDTIREEELFRGANVTVGEPVYLNGAWYTSRCVVSAFEADSPETVGKVWAFVSEGTLTHEQHLYYGMADSLDTVKELFDGTYYRQSGRMPNIKDEGVRSIKHNLMQKHVKKFIEEGWSNGDIDDLRNIDRVYQEVVDAFIKTIVDGVVGDNGVAPAITREDTDNAKAQARAENTDQAEPQVNDGPGLEDTEGSAENGVQPVENNISQQAGDSVEDVVPSQAEEPAPQVEEAKSPRVKDRDLFDAIVRDKKGLSGVGRKAIADRNISLKQLTRTPRKDMERMLPNKADIRKLTQILDENGYEHPKWLDD